MQDDSISLNRLVTMQAVSLCHKRPFACWGSAPIPLNDAGSIELIKKYGGRFATTTGIITIITIITAVNIIALLRTHLVQSSLDPLLQQCLHFQHSPELQQQSS